MKYQSSNKQKKPTRKIREQMAFDFRADIAKQSESVLERIGTFRDSLRAPIHRWFRYPAGFSFKLVDTFIEDCRLNEANWVIDPFMGSGTTSVAAKQYGVNSIGIEAHPFVYQVAHTKTFWEFDMSVLYQHMQSLITELSKQLSKSFSLDVDEFPELIHKCYSEKNLARLKIIRDAINLFHCPEEERALFRLALTDTLRTASSAGTGWPYISPSKYHAKQSERDGFEVFNEQLRSMYDDLKIVLASNRKPVKTQLYQMDARSPYPIESESVDLGVTSPPYLNNFDYADRTRLEMYFWGWAKSWGEITEQVRDKLITAATTQIRRGEFSDDPVNSELSRLDSKVYSELRTKVSKLERLRLEKGGKKSYDLMVAGYFNDVAQVMKQVYRVLKPRAPFVMILGDSAPYGIHIQTEEYLGKFGLGIGFREYKIQQLRTRGDKWGHNPQRHKVGLRESILTLEK